jgi:small subunit ribosomal protein S8e
MPHHCGCFCHLQVRTQTLVKNCIVQIDAAPFKQWYQQHYGVELGQKKGAAVEEKTEESKVRVVVLLQRML